eukprot:5013772-Amphidinium_carterae.1
MFDIRVALSRVEPICLSSLLLAIAISSSSMRPHNVTYMFVRHPFETYGMAEVILGHAVPFYRMHGAAIGA